MYEKLLIGLRGHAKRYGCDDRCPCYDAEDRGYTTCSEELAEKAADAIEERDKYALTIQHEMMAEAESHIALVERLNKRIKELELHYCPHAIRNVHDRGDDSLCEKYKSEVTALPRWIPVTERCPEKSGDYLVFDDCRNLYVNEWHYLLKKWQYDDSRITHWQPLPEPPKEETK